MLIIGAGPTGLAVAKALGEAGIPWTLAEATDHVGGNWAHGVYRTAHIISSRKTTEYPDDPMPAHYPDFPSAAQMKAYFEGYAERHRLHDHIRFRHRVERVVPVTTQAGEAPGRRGYRVTFKTPGGKTPGGKTPGGERTERFPGVLVCNGHHWARALPEWAAGYAGEVIHSKDYKDPAQLRGKRVLVLGGGNSGCDVVSEAARVASHAEWSLRRGYWFMPKTLAGRPMSEYASPFFPLPVQRALVKSALRVAVGPYARYGLPEPDHELFEAHPTLSVEPLHYLKHGKLQVRPDVARAEGDELVFTDGTRGTYDLVVCATGFDVEVPMLPTGSVPVDGKTPQLTSGLLVPGYEQLFVVGAYQPRYGIGPLLRPTALLLAKWIRLQGEIDVSLDETLRSLGIGPPKTTLMDPHALLRQLWILTHGTALLRWRARQLAKRRGQPRRSNVVSAGFGARARGGSSPPAKASGMR